LLSKSAKHVAQSLKSRSASTNWSWVAGEVADG